MAEVLFLISWFSPSKVTLILLPTAILGHIRLKDQASRNNSKYDGNYQIGSLGFV